MQHHPSVRSSEEQSTSITLLEMQPQAQIGFAGTVKPLYCRIDQGGIFSTAAASRACILGEDQACKTVSGHTSVSEALASRCHTWTPGTPLI